MNRFLIFGSILFCACCSSLAGQTGNPSQTAQQPGSTGKGNADTEPPGLGFSIETEMFTYKSVEVNSEVVACDIARYLYQGTLTDAPSGSQAPCAIQGAAQTTSGIIIISSDSPLLADFQVWRADMATMASLEAAADQVCKEAPAAAPPNPPAPPANPPGNNGGDLKGRGGLTIPAATPAGQAVGTLGDFIKLFASSQSISSVGGTVRDQALMIEVARQLRALNALVLIPEIYSPHSLGGTAYTSSPYLQNIANILAAYQKCERAKAVNSAGSSDDSKTAAITELISDLDSFIKGLVPPAAPAPKPAGSNDNGGVGQQTPTVQSTAPAQSHFAAVYAADGLARQIGISGNGEGGPSAIWQHVLWLKALESGGSVIKDTNIFRTRTEFSGGAVDSYALFRLNGDIVCSGNVYSFQSPVNLKHLDKAFRAPPEKDIVGSPLLRSTCSLLPGESQ